jgi:hypothetical protein
MVQSSSPGPPTYGPIRFLGVDSAIVTERPVPLLQVCE